ncbi:UDP-glycosyltransferase UGT4 isoform X1 [Bemisia tabaci]
MFTNSILAFFIFSIANAYSVLVIQPGPSFSHQQPIMSLTEALVAKGHHVFAVTPNEVQGLQSDNYTHVDLSFSYTMYAGGTGNKADKEALNLQKPMTLWEFIEPFRQTTKIPPRQFKSEAFLKFQKKVKAENLRFDVVIGQWCYIPFICGMTRYLSSSDRCPPIISFSTFSKDEFNEAALGSLPHPSFIPLVTPFTDKMSLWQKIQNWAISEIFFPKLRDIMEEAAEEFFRQNYGPGAGRLVAGCWSNVSLVINTGNFVTAYPRPLSPNVIEVGPMHIRAPEKLPQNLQEWLDGAKEGVIYFSLGSNMRSKSLPQEVLSNLLRVFRELPDGYRVLWKWEEDEQIPGQSENILTTKWSPQQSVLAHPKVKVFMMQGGHQSFQEAVHYGVPTIGIPWFADQEANVLRMETLGIGVLLKPQNLYCYKRIKSIVDRILHDDSFSKNAIRMSAISREFTLQSISKAVFYVEHVAKYGGAEHLRPSTADINYFQYLCLDLITLILCVIFSLFYIIRQGFKLSVGKVFIRAKMKRF